MPTLIYEKFERYALFTMNRPERLNAMGAEMNAELDAALADFKHDPAMRVGIVTGAGRAFSSGMDLKQAAERAQQGQAGQAPAPGRLHESIADSRKPFIAAVNGLAVGGGMERALECDIRICSTEAYFSLAEPKVGQIAPVGMQYLPRMMSTAAASYILLTGANVSAEQALAFGLVTEVVPPDRLLPRAVEIAEMIAANAPLSVEATKAALRLWRMQGSVEAQTLHEWARRTIVGSEDYREGPIAFAEKRRPVWKGR